MATLAHSTDCCASPRPAAGTSAENAADPVLSAVLAYREEESRISALPDPDFDDVPMPAWERLEKGPRLPAATTREGAVEALRTAAEFHSHSTSRFFVANLIQAALGFLDAAPPADPVFEAIAAWRTASDHFWTLGSPEAPEVSDSVLNAAGRDELTAAFAALKTAPITLFGLRAFCEMAAEMSRREAECSGLAGMHPDGEDVNAEIVFMQTLATAARNLLPEAAMAGANG